MAPADQYTLNPEVWLPDGWLDAACQEALIQLLVPSNFNRRVEPGGREKPLGIQQTNSIMTMKNDPAVLIITLILLNDAIALCYYRSGKRH